MSRTSHDEFVVESQEPAVRRSRFCGLRDFCDLADLWLSASRFGHFFRLGGSGHPQEIVTSSVFREVRAGLTTFATMAYIIAVNASMLSQTGGTCECTLTDKHQCDSIPKFVTCKEEVRRDLITATAAIAGMATLVFGLLTNLPVAIAYVRLPVYTLYFARRLLIIFESWHGLECVLCFSGCGCKRQRLHSVSHRLDCYFHRRLHFYPPRTDWHATVARQDYPRHTQNRDWCWNRLSSYGSRTVLLFWHRRHDGRRWWLAAHFGRLPKRVARSCQRHVHIWSDVESQGK
ncbi:putative xanthine/uracil permease [Beauveria bassiana]|nr:putative xanthine/uracil permease [Beauveria bassiana]